MIPQSAVLGSVTAVASAPFDKIHSMVTTERARLLLGLNQASTPGVAVDIDPDTGTIALQGQFWYRGEYTFAQHAEGTEITYRIKNVSGFPDWVIRMWQRPLLKRQQHDLKAFAAALPSRIA